MVNYILHTVTGKEHNSNNEDFALKLREALAAVSEQTCDVRNDSMAFEENKT